MPEMIRDGKGRGNIVGVDNDNRLMTNTVVTTQRSHVSASHAESYSFSTGLMTFGAPNIWHWVTYFRCDSASKNLYVDSVIVSWDGGAINYNRPVYLDSLIPTRGPIGNYEFKIPSQNNRLSTNLAEATVWIWDGTDTGMTVLVPDRRLAGTAHTQGHTIIPLEGNVIIGLNEAVGLKVMSPEVGKFSVGMNFYFVDKEADI